MNIFKLCYTWNSKKQAKDEKNNSEHLMKKFSVSSRLLNILFECIPLRFLRCLQINDFECKLVCIARVSRLVVVNQRLAHWWLFLLSEREYRIHEEDDAIDDRNDSFSHRQVTRSSSERAFPWLDDKDAWCEEQNRAQKAVEQHYPLVNRRFHQITCDPIFN